MNYTKLKAGNVRKSGDEVRSKHAVSPAYAHMNFEGHPKDLIPDWRPTHLVGSILNSDLMHLEFRRPV